ncbi:hypothetical protein H0H92_012874 [Tricholoma furcatifolium]|nr:hypothetical protein H0H92_012874 [Tricholoma furcatifolium]
MSSYSYPAPSSPTYGFFPTGPAAPHAFASMHQSPRDTHAIIAVFGVMTERGKFGITLIDDCSELNNRFSPSKTTSNTMPPLRNTAPTDHTAYSLTLLSEYTHTLDTLPFDLTRNFADLRELDAVLSSSVASLTAKINTLTLMIEQGTSTKEQRLWLLNDILDEAGRLKLGGEDKIRVACQAADSLKSNLGHLRTLAEHIPNFDASSLDRKTTYPHVASRSYLPVVALETGRRRRGGYGSLLTSAPDASPVKKRQRVLQRDEDLDIMRSPKKDKTELNNSRSRGRGKKTDRAASPSESLVSITSHNHPQTNGVSSYRPTSTRPNNSSSTSKRSRPAPSNRSATPHLASGDPYDQNGLHANGHGGSGSTSSRRDAYNAHQGSSHHPSHHYQNGTGAGGGGGAGGGPNGMGHGHHTAAYDNMHVVPPNMAQDWSPPLAQQLEGPGMPVSRSVMPIIPIPTSVGGPTTGGDAGADGADGEGDSDDKSVRLNGSTWLVLASSRRQMADGSAILVVVNEMQNEQGVVESGEQAVEEQALEAHDTHYIHSDISNRAHACVLLIFSVFYVTLAQALEEDLFM